MKKQKEKNKETTPITWSADWYLLYHSQSLCQTLNPIYTLESCHKYEDIIITNNFERLLYFYQLLSSLSQMRYSLVVILDLNSVSEVQYKDMMTDRW